MKYEGNYDTFEKPMVSDSFFHVCKHIEFQAGYCSDRSEFKAWETAWINQYNWIGRKIANYYFADSKKEWVRTPNKITSYYSWDSAKWPFKGIAQWYLRVFGYKEKQDKILSEIRLDKMAEEIIKKF